MKAHNIFLILITSLALVISACSASTDVTDETAKKENTGDGGEDGSGKGSNGGSGACQTEEVDIPMEVDEAILGEGKKFAHMKAYQLKDCSYLAVGTYFRSAVHVIKFTKDEKLDKSYGPNGQGWEKVEVITAFAKYAHKMVENGKYIYVVGHAWSEQEWDGGAFVMRLNSKGQVDQKAYKDGVAFKYIVKGRSSAKFNIKKAMVNKSGKLKIEGNYHNFAAGKVLDFKFGFSTKKPASPSKMKIPKTCDLLNYDSGAVDSQIWRYNQSTCDRMSFFYEYMWDRNTIENITFSMDGTCKDTKVWGTTCFGYEKGGIVRYRLDRNWEFIKSYYAISDFEGSQMCGIYTSGTKGRLVVSKHPPGHKRFYKDCNFY